MESEKENIESPKKFQCIICNEEKEFYSIGHCNHDVTCLYCTLKCRSFYNDKRCPLCNIILNEVFISPVSEKHTFEELNKNDKNIYFQDDDFENNNVYFIDISSKEESLKLKGFKCPINICLSEPFENFNQLNKHLNENHMKYYCDICLKDGKKFLSEQNVYSKEELKNHIIFGSYKDNIFPHPKCPFCKDLYYNDELLFKHMTQLHFLCEICKNKGKKIIFYSVLPNLIQHNKIKHYCCPYKECVNDLYVSFGTEKEFTGHLISKHHMNDIGGKLNSIVIENQPQEISYPEKFDISLNRDEFNFSNYIKKLNERYINHKDELEKRRVIENKFNDNKFDYNDIEVEVIYANDNNNNNNNKKKNNYKNNNYKNNNYKNNNNDELKLNIQSQPYIPKTKKGKFQNQDFKQNKNNQIIFVDDKNSNHKKSDSLDYEFLFQYYLTLIKDYITNRIKIREVDEDEIKLPKETIYQLIMVINKIETKRQLLELSSIQNFGLPMENINTIKNLLMSETNDSNKEKLYIEFDNLTMKNMLILYKYISTALKKITGSFFKLEFEQIDEDLYENFIKRPIKIETKIESKNNSFAINYIINNNNKIYFEEYKSHNSKKKKRKNWNRKPIPGLNEKSNQKITNIYDVNNKVNNVNKIDLNEKQDKKENQNKSLNEIKNELNEEEEKDEEKEKENSKIDDSEEDIKKDDIKENNNKEKKNEMSKLSMLINNKININDNQTNNNVPIDKKKYGKKGKKKGKFIDFEEYNK